MNPNEMPKHVPANKADMTPQNPEARAEEVVQTPENRDHIESPAKTEAETRRRRSGKQPRRRGRSKARNGRAHNVRIIDDEFILIDGQPFAYDVEPGGVSFHAAYGAAAKSPLTMNVSIPIQSVSSQLKGGDRA